MTLLKNIAVNVAALLLVAASARGQVTRIASPTVNPPYDPTLPQQSIQVGIGQTGNIENWLATQSTTIGTGDGTTKIFTPTLAVVPVGPTSVSIAVSGTSILLSDDGHGNLAGKGLVVGTVNYATGALSFTFQRAPASGAVIAATWGNVVSYVTPDGNLHSTGFPAASQYIPSTGTGLTLNIGSGVALCGSPPAIVSYAGGTLTLTASQTNYVYLDPVANCAPAFNTTGFGAGQIPIATVITGASSITTVTDARTWFVSGIPLLDKGGQVFNAKLYCAVSGTQNYTCLANAVAAAVAAGGGVVDTRSLQGTVTINSSPTASADWSNNLSGGVNVPITILAGSGTTFVCGPNYIGYSAQILNVQAACGILRSNTWIEGVGPGRAVFKLANATADFTRPFSLVSGASNVKITGIEIDGNKANVTGASTQNHCIFLAGNDRVTIQNNYIHDCNGDGVVFESGAGGTTNFPNVVYQGSGANPAQNIGTGDGTTINFTFTLSNPQVVPGSVTITAGATSGTDSSASTKVNTSGTAVTWVSGPIFSTGGIWNGLPFFINGIAAANQFTISTVTDSTHLTLTSSAGTQTNVSGSVIVSLDPGNITGTGIAVAGINYSTGVGSVTFSTAPAVGTPITVSYIGGAAAQGFTSHTLVSDNYIANNQRGGVSLISSFESQIRGNTFSSNIDFGSIHCESDSTGQYNRSLLITDNTIDQLPGGGGISCTGFNTSPPYEGTSHNEISHNLVNGGQISIFRASHTTVSFNTVKNINASISIDATDAPFSIIAGNIVDGPSAIAVCNPCVGILATATDGIGDGSGSYYLYAPGISSAIISNNIVEKSEELGIEVVDANNALISGNVVRDTQQSVATSDGIDVAQTVSGLGTGDIIMGNQSYDDQAVPTQKIGFTLQSLPSPIMIGNYGKGNITQLWSLISLTTPTQYGNFGLPDVTQQPITPVTSTVGALPAAAAGNAGQMRQVSDSTNVASEGQTCVGSSTNVALAFSNGSVWKCF